MKKETLRNALSAHGWLGLLISVPLFIVFWAGAITLFYPEISKWSLLPHYPVQSKTSLPSLNTIFERVQVDYRIESDEMMSLRLPTDSSAHIIVFFRTVAEDTNKRTFVRLLIDPVSGEILDEDDKFHMADFLYELHFNLKLPLGRYIVGIITLFFLMLILTGIIVQLKKLIEYFFKYRHQGSLKDKMKDMHNVVGVISLPYSLMYALTGLMFNLGILLQIPSALLLYQGDDQAMALDAGFASYREKPTGVAAEMPDLNALLATTEASYDVNVRRINIHNYGDEAAAVRLIGRGREAFSSRLDRHFILSSNDFAAEYNPPPGNVFAHGTEILVSMHFANFAGVDVRLLFFAVAIGICGMIVAGNVLWFVKNQRRPSHPRTLNVMKALTLGGCVGVIPATAFIFLLERVLPIGFFERAHMIEVAFLMVLLAYVVSGFIIPYSKRYIGWALLASASLLFITFVADWVLFSRQFLALYSDGHPQPVQTSLGLVFCALVLLLIAAPLLKTRSTVAQGLQDPQPYPAK